MKYRKKPVVIEAIQWTGNTTEIKEFCGNNCSYNVDDSAWKVGKGIPHEELVIHTLEGDMKARRNDYIIHNSQSHSVYKCNRATDSATSFFCSWH